MTKVFPTAIEARAGARNNVRIYEEIRHLEAAVLAAIDAGDLSVSVTDSYMTSLDTGVEYCAVWLNELEDRSKAEQMVIVDRHFTNMGYEISRKLANDTSVGETVTATVIVDGVDPDLEQDEQGVAEVQSIAVPTEFPGLWVTFSISVGSDNMIIRLAPGEINTDRIVSEFRKSRYYNTAPFILESAGPNITITWKEKAHIPFQTALRYSYNTSTFAWEILW